jgi:uncharacterized membrane protein YhhN
MKKLFLTLFVCAASVELIHGMVDIGIFHVIAKSLLIPSLAAFYYITSKSRTQSVSNLLLLTLLLSWIGDIILMMKGDQYFMLGLIAFLLAHITYIFVYRQHRNKNQGESLQGVQRIRFAFPIVLAGAGLVVILYPHLGALQIPVMIYALVITVMTLNALFRYGRTNGKSFVMVFAGAILFMASDSILAVSKFIEPLFISGFWIMLTYVLAQFLIVQGLLAHQETT